MLLERAWRQTQDGEKPVKPWPWADTWPVARLSVPALGETAIVLETTSGQALAFGPGRMTGMADFGAPGFSVIAAHKDTHFAFLKDLAAGETLLVETRSGDTHYYRVTGHEIVDTRKPLYVNTAPGSHLVLSTCYPFDALAAQTPFRYLVYAEWLGTRP